VPCKRNILADAGVLLFRNAKVGHGQAEKSGEGRDV